MKSTKYSNFCFTQFGKFFNRHKKEVILEKNNKLEMANIKMEYDEYNSTALMTSILGTVIALIITIIIYAIYSNLYSIVLLVVLPISILLSLVGYFIFLPQYLIQKRAENIDKFLPYAINFISSMAVAGVSPTEIFQTLSTIKVYGDIQIEAKRISKEIKIMGIDNVTAIKHAIEISPSKKFKSFLQGMIGTIQSGSDLHSYLATIVEKYLEDDLIEKKKNLELLSVVAEAFVIAVIAFPIFLVIILSVMGFFGGSIDLSINILFLFSFVALPAIYLGFYLLIRTSTVAHISRFIPGKKNYFKDYYSENKNAFYIFLFSVIALFIFLSVIFMIILNGLLESNFYLFIDLSFIGLLFLIGPIGFYHYKKLKEKNEIQNRFPEFLVEVGDSLSSGMNAFEAIKVAEKGRYGIFSPEIKKMKTQLSWNIAIKDVFSDFAFRMKSGIIQRIVITINEGLMMGGSTSKIFKAAAKEVNQVNQIEHQRKASMTVYMSVIILCFFVFLAIILILDKTIFSTFFSIQTQQIENLRDVISINIVDPLLLKYSLFSFVYVQSVGAGLLAGYMVDGRLTSGLRYSFILALISFIVFKTLF